jgi:hypothetical protein
MQALYGQRFIPPNQDNSWGVTPTSLGTVNSSVDVFVVPADFMLTPEEVTAVLRWASYDRGIVVAGSVSNIRGYNRNNFHMVPANQLLAPFGIQVNRAC